MGLAALPRLRLSRRDRRLLREVVRRQTAPARLVNRARIVLMSGQGLSAEEIGRRLSIHPKPVAKWREPFKHCGLATTCNERTLVRASGEHSGNGERRKSLLARGS